MVERYGHELEPGLVLQLERKDRMEEMEFYFPNSRIPAGTCLRLTGGLLLRHYLEGVGKSEKHRISSDGYLKGLVDLIFRRWEAICSIEVEQTERASGWVRFGPNRARDARSPRLAVSSLSQWPPTVSCKADCRIILRRTFRRRYYLYPRHANWFAAESSEIVPTFPSSRPSINFLAKQKEEEGTGRTKLGTARTRPGDCFLFRTKGIFRRRQDLG